MMKLTVAFHNFVNMFKTRTAGHRARGWLRNALQTGTSRI